MATVKSLYRMQWAKENKTKVAETRKRTMIKHKQFVIRQKCKPCVDCGIQYNPWQMQFDHIKGSKVDNIGSMQARYSYKRIQEEIDKCDVVCANCHANRTHGRMIAKSR